MGIELNNDQIHAAYLADDWWYNSTRQLFEISGSAGTGKTTLVRYLIERFNLTTDQVLFIAYTGKAASQLIRNGLPARTIHSACYEYIKRVKKDENGNIMRDSKGKALTEGVFALKEKLPSKIKLIIIDEGTMVNEKTAKDIFSFGLPVIVLGDLNQLPPVFGNTIFFRKPDVVLRQIMRQAEGNPIIYLSQQIIAGKKLQHGVYGNSAVIYKSELNDFQLKHADIILTPTNKLRHQVNNMFREDFNQFKRLDMPYVGEKIICKRNNWDFKIEGEIYLTNGICGTIEYVDRSSFNGKSIKIDFKPEFSKRAFKNIKANYNRLMNNALYESMTVYDRLGLDEFEFAYAQTPHSAQGSQWKGVVYLNQRLFNNEEDQRKLDYTAVTRAQDYIIIVTE